MPENTTLSDFESFALASDQAFGKHLRGEPDAFIALWSKRDDVAVLGAVGSYAIGYAHVIHHLRNAAKTLNWSEHTTKRLLTSVSDDLAVTVCLEQMQRHTGEQPAERTLRTTQAYRREDGKWTLLLRHANAVTDANEDQEEKLLASAT